MDARHAARGGAARQSNWSSRIARWTCASKMPREAQGLRKPSEREGTLRIVSIDGLDRSACGGTHVRGTGRDRRDPAAQAGEDPPIGARRVRLRRPRGEARARRFRGADQGVAGLLGGARRSAGDGGGAGGGRQGRREGAAQGRTRTGRLPGQGTLPDHGARGRMACGA